MSISSRLSVGIHLLVLIEVNKDAISSSQFLAESVNTNPALIRKITGMLKKAGLIEVHPGIAGAKLAKKLSDISLLDVYKAVDVVQDKQLFNLHNNPNLDCPVGKNILLTIEPVFLAAQLAMEEVLENVNLETVVRNIKENTNC